MELKKKNFIEKVINFLLNILIFIFGIILLISLYSNVQIKILGNDYTNFFGYSIFEVQTGSMADEINAGDWIVVKLTQKVELNDVVTYKLDGNYITHRIIEVYNGTYITKGDANNAKDEPVDKTQIVGKVENVLANFGVLRKTLFNPAVLITIIITLCIFNLVIKKNKKDSLKGKEDKDESQFLEFLIKKIKIAIKNIKKKKAKNKVTKKIPAENEKIDILNINMENKEHKDDGKISKDFKYDEKKEEELEKTSYFRAISVNKDEVSKKYNDEYLNEEEEAIKEEEKEDELDKTSLYRVIKVDSSEINNTFLEIAENQMNEPEKNINIVNEVKKVQIEDEDDSLTKINLESFKDKKGKNIIETVMNIKKEELEEITSILIDEDSKLVREVSVRKAFIDIYISARYYNCYDDIDLKNSRKRLITKTEETIKRTLKQLISDYDGNNNKYDDTVVLYANAFLLIANLENARDSITKEKAKKEFYKKVFGKYYADWNEKKVYFITHKIVKIQKKYSDVIEQFLKELDTNMFDLIISKISVKDKMYGLKLKHNIKFSNVYSNYVIDKTYTEGVVAENKLSVLLTLLSAELIKNMISSDFDKKYVINIPESLYSKERKFKRILRMIDDEYAKENVAILINFNDLLGNLVSIKKAKKSGYKFALVFEKGLTINKKDVKNIYIGDYIFVNKKDDNFKNIMDLIPEDWLDKVIYKDVVESVLESGGD